ncbi:hypothetical protein [Alkaliphilus pronyensis]|uniref:hypothetical protein n=1 Tax=Alkaliphilus pronyensis TaxID=1482732 RepID=UPI001865728D|nr:hypothetical protein [Alkaliphilus pronyensis]
MEVSIDSLYISIINSFLVAAAAIGNYDIITNKMKKREVRELERLNKGKDKLLSLKKSQ